MTSTDVYVLPAVFITADKNKNCGCCEIKLSKNYTITDTDIDNTNIPECKFYCGDKQRKTNYITE